jgi:hypothetical protein
LAGICGMGRQGIRIVIHAEEIEQILGRARQLAANGENEPAKQVYVDALRLDPTHFSALNELGILAYGSGHRSAARTVYSQAVLYHPSNPIGRVNLANILLEDGNIADARVHYQAALAIDPDFPEAHQGLARALTRLGDSAADEHWQKGFVGHAVVSSRQRGVEPAVPLLLLNSARGGNIPMQHWFDDRRFAVTMIYADFYEPVHPLPPHALIVNAIGDADLCGAALAGAEQILAHSTAPVINPPALVRPTARADNVRRLAGVPGVIAPRVMSLPRANVAAAGGLGFPLLLRAPGFHTGQHFVYVEDCDALANAAAGLPGDDVLAIEYLDARGPDGMARKYRVMFVDGVLYPLHLAISADWKVHYFTAAMATNAGYRDEERRFLDDMPAVLGQCAMAALAGIGAALGLDYAGVDFGLTPDGSVLLFEANATMVVYPPDADPIWDYRRRAITDVLDAVKRMMLCRAGMRDRC